jgi:phosphoglycerate kinase
MVATKIAERSALRCVSVERVGKKEMMVDLGHASMKEWAQHIQSAKTILWNGPVGVSEIKNMGAGSRFLARVIGGRAKGAALGIAGGGDTIPVIVETGALDWFDFVSTGGGAMLEFLVEQGRLPGLLPLLR